ncbi:hypothetical protein RF11_05266 [Thelohanellus kitauei]|uniref:FACT complex subunit SSRP1/POB3 N-terminal PH domain-containing protein n=1 Tax=Thelohanellus kitauei TaxID=669202 RepID=A0A0C2NAN5_THEKT|nr:hypothetical protein RF11_05266 [Thelohanellus kitauei]
MPFLPIRNEDIRKYTTGMTMDTLVYNETCLITHGHKEDCTMKVTKDGFELDVNKNKQVKIPISKIKSVSWCQMAKGQGIKISCEDELFYQVCSIDSLVRILS